MENKPLIIDADDPLYHEWLRRHHRVSNHYRGQGARDSFSARYNRALRQLEDMTIEFLGTNYGLQTGKVLRVFKGERSRGKSPFRFYELDLIKQAPGGTPLFCEIKHSISPKKAMNSARRQIRVRQAAVAECWPESSGVAICYLLSWIKYEPESQPQLASIPDLDLFFSRDQASGISGFYIDGRDLLSEMEASGYRVAELRSELTVSYEEMIDPVSTVHLDTQPLNSLSQAFPDEGD